MIKSFTTTTREIDDLEAAISEIKAGIPLGQLLTNTIGIISCFSEFVDTGVLNGICEAMPFACVGTTTCVCASNDEVDQVMLTLLVLTSDDCSFETTGIKLTENYDKEIQESVADLLGKTKEQPAVILSFLPLLNHISGDMIIESVDKVTNSIPLFGTTAVDHLIDYSSARTIYNSDGHRDVLVLTAVYGNVEVTFDIASLDEDKIRRQKAIITESDGNILIGVNGKASVEYLSELGITREELATGLGILPLIIDHRDGTRPVARAVFALTPEGYSVCGGKMPVNASISIGRVDALDVLTTTETVLKPLIDNEGVILSFSCMARYLALGAHNTAEAEKVAEVARGTNYMFACSGGEVCPSIDKDGKTRNFYHNYTIVLCRIK